MLQNRVPTKSKEKKSQKCLINRSIRQKKIKITNLKIKTKMQEKYK